MDNETRLRVERLEFRVGELEALTTPFAKVGPVKSGGDPGATSVILGYISNLSEVERVALAQEIVTRWCPTCGDEGGTEHRCEKV